MCVVAQDPYSEFARIFSKFASAERVTGAEPDTDSEDEEGAGASGRDGEDGARVKVPPAPASVIRNEGFVCLSSADPFLTLL